MGNEKEDLSRVKMKNAFKEGDRIMDNIMDKMKVEIVTKATQATGNLLTNTD